MKLENKAKFKFGQLLILSFLFLGTLNLWNLYVYFLFGAAVIAILMNFRDLHVDWSVFVLIAFSFCYLIFFPDASSSITTALKCLIYPICYILGLNFIRKENDLESQSYIDKQVQLVITICALGMFAHYLLNMLVNFDSLFRNNIDFWTGETMVATGHAGLAILAVGLFAAWLFDSSKRKIVALFDIFPVSA